MNAMSDTLEYTSGPDVKAEKIGPLEAICERLDGHNKRLAELRGSLETGFDRVLGPVPPEPAAEDAADPPENSAIQSIHARLQRQNALLIHVEREAARLSEL